MRLLTKLAATCGLIAVGLGTGCASTSIKHEGTGKLKAVKSAVRKDSLPVIVQVVEATPEDHMFRHVERSIILLPLWIWSRSEVSRLASYVPKGTLVGKAGSYDHLRRSFHNLLIAENVADTVVPLDTIRPSLRDTRRVGLHGEPVGTAAVDSMQFRNTSRSGEATPQPKHIFPEEGASRRAVDPEADIAVRVSIDELNKVKTTSLYGLGFISIFAALIPSAVSHHEDMTISMEAVWVDNPGTPIVKEQYIIRHYRGAPICGMYLSSQFNESRYLPTITRDFAERLRKELPDGSDSREWARVRRERLMRVARQELVDLEAVYPEDKIVKFWGAKLDALGQ